MALVRKVSGQFRDVICASISAIFLASMLEFMLQLIKILLTYLASFSGVVREFAALVFRSGRNCMGEETFLRMANFGHFLVLIGV